MPVDPRKPRRILVIHGVQTGTNADINPHKKIQQLVENRLAVPLDFKTDIYKYENISDAANRKVLKIFDLFAKPLLNQVRFGRLLGKVVRNGVDLVGDVVLALKNGSTAQTIRQGLVDRIEEYYDDGHPLYVVAHSLGSIYALDAINQLIRRKKYFDRANRKSWPVQGFLTIGSPLGLDMFKRNKVASLGVGSKYLRWLNYWDRQDPVVTGNFYGKPNRGYQIAERFTQEDGQGNPLDTGWYIKDRIVDTGQVWMMAHTAYWNDPAVGDDLATMVTS